MNLPLAILIAASAIAVAPLHLLSAERTSTQGAAVAPQRVDACKLLPKEEVKKHLPWADMFDRMPIVEEAIGASGSSCEYPTVGVQVLAFTRGFVEAARESAPLEAISGLGDEAYFRNNQNRFAELLVKVGPRLLTLQASAEGKIESVKPPLIELARAYVAKLR